MLKDGKEPKEIAKRIGKHYTTVYREIKRGTVLLRNGTTWEDIPTYCADVAQRKQETASHNKGLPLKIGSDIQTVRFMEHLIKDLRYSAYAVNIALKTTGKPTLCVQTIYNYINTGVFLNVDRNDLIYNKTNKKKEETTTRRPSLHNLGARSIEDRPKEVNKRRVFGHWEMDTVQGMKGTTPCLLVLTERLTRIEIIRLLPNKCADSVLKEINRIERELGVKRFRQIFKTITCDNGVEFLKHREIETSYKSKMRRTWLYFCHAFASSERGSNENANKLIRKYVPKGADIGNYTREEIKQIENLINNYPRKLFNGLSSTEYAHSIGF